MTIKNHDLVDIDDIDYVRETSGASGAYLVRDAKDVEHWIPKSQVEYDKDSKTFTMPEWLAEDRGFV